MKMPERTGGWLAVAGAATLALMWLWPTPRSDEPAVLAPPPPVVATAPPAPPTTYAGSTATPAPANAPAEIAGSAPPPGISPEQWSALQAQLRTHPDGPAELRRLADYFSWSDALRRFRESRHAGTAAPDLRSLAQILDEGLPERLRRSEVTAAEARQIESALLEAIEPDPSRRADQLERRDAAHLAPAAPTDPRQAEFERRQSELVAAWSAQPAAARDQGALARDLETLRQQSFGPGSR